MRLVTDPKRITSCLSLPEFFFKLRAIPGIHFKKFSKTCVAWLSFGFVI
jgi:hypothetical protein